jgi:hypothetical protein
MRTAYINHGYINHGQQTRLPSLAGRAAPSLGDDRCRSHQSRAAATAELDQAGCAPIARTRSERSSSEL